MGLPAFSESTSTTSSQTPQQQHEQSSSTGVATGAGANTGAGVTRPKTEAELEADRLYEEAMEEEYAKRDGGSDQRLILYALALIDSGPSLMSLYPNSAVAHLAFAEVGQSSCHSTSDLGDVQTCAYPLYG
ncbi:hypothetical protein FLONG3_5615 [Fusarium longipes]|uniref:Uncharacterized protein n=1 Tax=Fusarium longipes TaxID=694270 RepID=A0A395ST51_9HYPO|nr:hypothetical protein FLONG3_5615 [Fusarium longipes]